MRKILDHSKNGNDCAITDLWLLFTITIEQCNTMDILNKARNYQNFCKSSQPDLILMSFYLLSQVRSAIPTTQFLIYALDSTKLDQKDLSGLFYTCT